MVRVRKQTQRQQQGRESRAKIIEATYKVISEYGYGGTTLAAVTAEAGLPASSVYWHFENKDALLAAVLEHSYARWRENGPNWATANSTVPKVSGFTQLSREAAKIFTAAPDFWSLGLVLTIQKKVVDPKAREKFVEIRQHTQQLVAEFWRGWLAEETLEFHPKAPEYIARAMMALGDGYLIASQIDEKLPEEQANDEIAACITGIVRAYQDCNSGGAKSQQASF